MNYLTENEIFTLKELEARLSSVSAKYDTLSDSMKAKSARMKVRQELIRLGENYKWTKPVYDELNSIKWKKQREIFGTSLERPRIVIHLPELSDNFIFCLAV